MYWIYWCGGFFRNYLFFLIPEYLRFASSNCLPQWSYIVFLSPSYPMSQPQNIRSAWSRGQPLPFSPLLPQRFLYSPGMVDRIEILCNPCWTYVFCPFLFLQGFPHPVNLFFKMVPPACPYAFAIIKMEITLFLIWREQLPLYRHPADPIIPYADRARNSPPSFPAKPPVISSRWYSAMIFRKTMYVPTRRQLLRQIGIRAHLSNGRANNNVPL